MEKNGKNRELKKNYTILFQHNFQYLIKLIFIKLIKIKYNNKINKIIKK